VSRRVILLATGLLAAGLLLAVALRRPTHSRRWVAEQSRLPEATVTGDRVTVREVRNFRWTGPASFVPAWEERQYQLDQLATVWYVLVPFSRRWRGAAHSFVSFGFDDGRYLAISVEARREAGERYGVIAGLLRRFELIYVIGDERDLIGRRAVYDGSDVYLYPIRASRAAIRAMFLGMLERANQLRRRPEFYNTLTNNCTLNLVRHVNAVAPGLVRVSWRVLAPGYSDEVAYRLGLIATPDSMAEARLRFRINDRAREALHDAEFSRRLRD
jgi:hypothetical protein